MALAADRGHLGAFGAPVGGGRKGGEIGGPHGQGRLGLPGQPFGDIVADRHRGAGGRHVAGSAGGSAKIAAGRPAPVGRVPLPPAAFGVIEGAVLGLGVDLDLGMIRAQMALVAGLGLARLDDRKAVARVAAAATALAPVRVDPAHGPRWARSRTGGGPPRAAPRCRGRPGSRWSARRRGSSRPLSQGSIFHMISWVLACLLRRTARPPWDGTRRSESGRPPARWESGCAPDGP